VDTKKETLIEQQFKTVAPRLVRFVENRIGRGLLPKGHDAKDVVQIAFQRLVAGSRAWNPEKVDLETHMKRSILRSMLGSKGLLGVKDMNKCEFNEEELLEHLNEDGIRTTDCLKDPIPDSDKEMAFSLLEKEIAGDSELENILTANRMGYSKPADIAEATGYDVKRVYWLQKKLAGYADKARSRLYAGRLEDQA